MPENNTDNHGLSRPLIGSVTGRDSEDWGTELNDNFTVIDERLIINDTDSNKSTYEPIDGALYFANDASQWYEGDGSSWVKIKWMSSSPDFDSLTVNGSNVLTEDSNGNFDADTLDGLNSTDFVQTSDGSLDADTLDGFDSTQFVQTSDNLDAETFDGRDSTEYGILTHDDFVSAEWTFEQRTNFENTIEIYGANGHIDLYESDNNNTNWRIEAQTGNLQFGRVDVGTFMQIDPDDGFRVEHPNGLAGSVMTTPPRSSAPSSPDAGTIACQDGVNWDPAGSGQEEIVAYINGSWTVIS